MSARIAVVALFVAACGAPDAPVSKMATPRATAAPVVVTPAVVASASAVPAAIPTVVPVAEELQFAASTNLDVRLRAVLPTGYAHDGSTDEWGDVCGPPVYVGQRPRRPRAAADTCVTFALMADQVVLAGKLGANAPSGAWVGLAMPPDIQFPDPQVLHDGNWRELTCTEMEGTPLAALCARHLKQVVRAMDPTARFYRIKSNAVSVHDAREGVPAVAPITASGAKFAIGAGGRSFEAVLPLSALPRAGAAPVQKVFLASGLGDLPTERPYWEDGRLPTPVYFEPLAELRSTVIQNMNTQMGSLALYQPGSDEVEVFAVGTVGPIREIVARKRKLFTPKIKTDALEAGPAPGVPYDLLAVRPKGGVAIVPPFDYWHYIDVAIVDGEPRVFTLYTSCAGGGPCGATITSGVIQPDGQTAGSDIEPTDSVNTTSVDSATPYVNPGGTVFGLRGTITSDGSRRPYDLRWTWNSKRKVYVGVQTGAH